MHQNRWENMKNRNKDFTNAVRGGGQRFIKVFHKIPIFSKQWLPLVEKKDVSKFSKHATPAIFKYCKMNDCFFTIKSESDITPILFHISYHKTVRQEKWWIFQTKRFVPH